MSVEASSLDGQPHLVQLHSHITVGESDDSDIRLSGILTKLLLEWVSGNRAAVVDWLSPPQNTGKSLLHQVKLQSPTPFAESSGQAQDSTVYYGVSIPASTLGPFIPAFLDGIHSPPALPGRS